jgi:hypothetical protein
MASHSQSSHQPSASSQPLSAQSHEFLDPTADPALMDGIRFEFRVLYAGCQTLVTEARNARSPEACKEVLGRLEYSLVRVSRIALRVD